MLNQLIQVILLALASSIVMVMHELPKAMIYAKIYNKNRQYNKRNIYALYQYIDPIGLVFCITNMTGFSKPYVYRLNDKKMNKTLGITGFISLLFIFIISVGLINFLGVKYLNLTVEEVSLSDNLFLSFTIYMALISLGMFLVNLFPIANFNMGLIIASISSDNYYSIIKNDYFIKMILILFMLFGVFNTITANIINLFIFL